MPNSTTRTIGPAGKTIDASGLEMRAGDSRRLLLDSQRKAAWSSFFRHKDQVVLSFRHPFASTSHRAQGSTFFSAFLRRRTCSAW